MKIFSWNVNGIRAVINKGEFQNFIDTYQPDVLCLQETKAKEGQAKIDLPEYKEYWNDAEKPGYSGTAIFTKVEPLSFERAALSGELVDGYGDLNNEGRVSCAEFKDFYVVSVYTPNSKRGLTRLKIREKWDAAFLQYLKDLEKIKPVIVGGDLNVAHKEIDLANPKQNKGKHGFTDEERAGFQACIDNGLIDTFRHVHGDVTEQYSWWSHWARARERNIGWRIDYFLTSGSLTDKIVDARIHPEQQGSDHCPVSVTMMESI